MAQVSLTEIRKSFAQTHVVRGVSLTIADGEFVVVVGPSGCGKSTLLRMIAGLETITSGEIRIGERVVNQLEPKDRDIAMVFQNYALYPHMSVFENMAYGLKIRGLSREAIAARVARAAQILELDSLLQRQPRALSGGQRQRVAMGRAIVREPAVFLFDEPLSNLDAKLRVQMRLELKALHQRLGTTSVYVTHDQVEAMTLAQRMVVLHAGVVEQIGAPLAVYAKPASTFVAGFIGSPPMNLLRGTINAHGTQFLLDAALAMDLPPGSVPASYWGQPMTLGVRPEHVLPCAPSEALCTVPITLTEALGADILVHATLGPHALVVRLAASAQPAAMLPIRFATEHMHWFDAAHGRRIEMK